MDQSPKRVQLPDGFRLLKTQVAGHTFQTGTEAVGLLQDASTGCVLKGMGKPECGERELGFYKSLEKDPQLEQVKLLVPRFFNKLQLMVNGREHAFLKLEDITHGMIRPCIMDIKIGKRTWDPVATAQKRAVEEQKYARCKQILGLCLPGFQVYKESDGKVEIMRHGKEYGKQLDVEGFRETIKLFLNTQPKVCEPLVREVLDQLYGIRSWFRVQTQLHFYASSLLIAYDFERLQEYLEPKKHLTTNGNAQNDESCSSDAVRACDDISLHPSLWVKIKMIDFAHVFPAESGTLDANYLFGLENLISVIEDLLVR